MTSIYDSIRCQLTEAAEGDWPDEEDWPDELRENCGMTRTGPDMRKTACAKMRSGSWPRFRRCTTR